MAKSKMPQVPKHEQAAAAKAPCSALQDSRLDARKQNILRAVIDDYIANAEPVGSKALVAKHQLNVSSATVRNEMAELEEMGYLEQPHTSAGRIPSDKGYRAYVDNLLRPEPLAETEKAELSAFVTENVAQLNDLIHKAAEALSETTELTSLVLSPRYGSSSLKQIKILMIEPGRALVIVVLSPGVVKDRLVHVPEVLSQSQLQSIANAIEAGLGGTRLDKISLVTVSAAAEGTEIPESLLNQVLYEAYISIKQAENIDLYIDGTHRLLKQPEFQDVDKAHRYLQVMHHERVLADYLDDLYRENPELPADGAEGGRPACLVRIGQELQLQGLEDCSFISGAYACGDEISGRIAIVGPRRMHYNKLISAISFVNRTLSRELKRLAQGSGE